MGHDVTAQQVEELVARVASLEARVAVLESGGPAPRRQRATSSASGGAGDTLGSVDWTTPYVVAELSVDETWIELHETSARPQLQRLIRQVVEEEGPVTDRLALDRVRRAWGLRRAGGRVQEAFDQALRQLVARSLIVRDGDAVGMPGARLDHVRVPTGDEATKRGAEDVPLVELALALRLALGELGGRADVDDLTMQVAKLFGWTRRGGAIQERLDAALEHAAAQGALAVDGSVVRTTHA
jgi:hypothetical protein